MSSRKNKPPLALDMEFGEALRRFAKVEPMELREKQDFGKKKPSGVKSKYKESLPESPI